MIGNRSNELWLLGISWEKAIARINERLTGGGFQVVRSFDLRSARASQSPYTCPYHGTGSCTCQLMVMLVYGSGTQLATLVAQGHKNKIHLFLVDTPEQRLASDLQDKIMEALVLSESNTSL